jgi:integrase
MNDAIRQLPLLAQSSHQFDGRTRRSRHLDRDSEALLEEFVGYRRAQGAAASTARHETSQLRFLCHTIGEAGRPRPPMALLLATDALVDHLSGRDDAVSATTSQARLRALGHLARFCAEWRGVVLTHKLEAIYERLPRRRPRAWNHTGVVLGGTRERRTPVGKTMLAHDLPQILEAGPHGATYRAVRDRALLVCACFTGLRLQELAALCWEQLEPDTTLVRIRARRGDVEVVLPGYGVVPTALGALVARGRRFGPSYRFGGTGPVFRRDQPPHAAISERQAFAIVKRALVGAGFPRAGQRDVRRAFVHWLLAQGLSDHEAMLAAGIRDARTVDALLERVRRLNAQRVVAELREGEPDEEAAQ